jgi:hypothetical protein
VTRRQRVLTGVALVVVVSAVVSAGLLVGHALGPRPLQPVAGPTGLPDVWRAGEHPFELSDRPIEAASLAVDGGGQVVLAAADGNGYRVHPVDAGVEWFRLSPDGRSLAWRESGDTDSENQPLVRVVRLADGRVTEVRVGPGLTSIVAAEWTPDGRRVLMAGGRGPRPEPDPVVWDVDVAAGRARVHCACAGMLPTPAGQVVRRPMPDHIPVVVAPDGVSWAEANPYGPGLEVTDVTGVTYPVRLAAGVDRLLAWTPAGIWLVTPVGGALGSYSRLLLIDPETGRTRGLTDRLPGPEVAPAADLAASGGVVRSEPEHAALERLLAVRAQLDNPFVPLVLLSGLFWLPVLGFCGLLAVAISQIGRPPPRRPPPPGPSG